VAMGGQKIRACVPYLFRECFRPKAPIYVSGRSTKETESYQKG
jgi:hypothetical protein